jgi:hypothetical protein
MATESALVTGNKELVNELVAVMKEHESQAKDLEFVVGVLRNLDDAWFVDKLDTEDMKWVSELFDQYGFNTILREEEELSKDVIKAIEEELGAMHSKLEQLIDDATDNVSNLEEMKENVRDESIGAYNCTLGDMILMLNRLELSLSSMNLGGEEVDTLYDHLGEIRYMIEN